MQYYPTRSLKREYNHYLTLIWDKKIENMDKKVNSEKGLKAHCEKITRINESDTRPRRENNGDRTHQ